MELNNQCFLLEGGEPGAEECRPMVLITSMMDRGSGRVTLLSAPIHCKPQPVLLIGSLLSSVLFGLKHRQTYCVLNVYYGRRLCAKYFSCIISIFTTALGDNIVPIS